ncbi:MAG: hypothetical protein M3R68_09650 [Acidobacteriota bacterium]|nr:hypothetical protein [Acidobacteriota bacterium]
MTSEDHESDRPKTRASASDLLLLSLGAALPRIIGAIWLPNAFGDAYAYTEQIYYMRRALLLGRFSFSNLFGFWLPLYQFICALISSLVGNPFYVPKLVSAVAGIGVCLLVFLLTFELTEDRWFSFANFALVAFNPYFVLYSSSAMTDVPHICAILLCGYCCIKNRWFLAACFAAAAGLMRIESWSFVLIIPLLQLLRERRVSVPGFMLLVAGPAFWLYVSWVVGGSPWKYFQIRNEYILQTLAADPGLAEFTLRRLTFDALKFIYTANPVVMVVCCATVFLRGWRQGLRRGRDTFASDVLLVLFFSNLTFLLLAYFTKNQPEIWPRYGLIFFALGLPLFADYLLRYQARRPYHFPRLAILVLALQFVVQLVDATRITLQNDSNQLAAQFLENEQSADPSLKVYCEDGAIRVLSGIPLEEFVDQYNSPADTESFLKSLREKQVRLLIYKDLPGSRLRGIVRTIQAGHAGLTLEEVVPKPPKKLKGQVVIYRVHGNEIASKHHDK